MEHSNCLWTCIYVKNRRKDVDETCIDKVECEANRQDIVNWHTFTVSNWQKCGEFFR
jgi:hypothetical protein